MKVVDFIVEERSKPCSFLLPLLIGEGDEMFIVLNPLNWGTDEFFFILSVEFYCFVIILNVFRK